MSKVVLSFFVWLVQIQSGFAYILIPPGGDTPVELVNMDNKFSVNTLLGNYIAYAIGIAGVLGVIGVTWGGIQMILSSGEDEKMKKARYILIYSLVGVLIAGLAFGIVDVISKFKL